MRNQPLAAVFTIAAALLAGAAPASPASPDSDTALWQRDVDAAFAAARSGGKLLLVDAYADWCGWCKTLEREVFPQPEFALATRDFVLLRIDVEDGGRGTELADRYQAWSLPTLLILEPSGALAGTVEGYAPLPDYLARLRAELATRERRLDAWAKTLAGGDTAALRRMAVDFYERHDGERAAALLERLLAIASLERREQAWTRYFLADAWRMAGDLPRARAAAAEAERAAVAARGAAEPELGERLELLAFWIAETARECAGAAGALASFEQRHPGSPFLAEARRAMTRLRAEAGPRCS